MEIIDMAIPIAPYPQPRVRARSSGKFASVYQPKEASDWKATFRSIVLGRLGGLGVTPPPWGDKPVSLEIYFGFQMTKSRWLKKSVRGPEFHNKRGDIDNLLKSAMDALNGVMWLDDGQVGEVQARKYILSQGQPPFIRLLVSEMKESSLHADWF